MSTAALLTVVASLIAGHHTPVSCSPPPGYRWTGATYGYTVFTRPAHVYLRACRAVALGRQPDLTTFAHELIHVEHPGWAHRKVYAVAPWYSHIVGRVLRRVRARS